MSMAGWQAVAPTVTIEDKFLRHLATWPRWQFLDEKLCEEWTGCSRYITQRLLLLMLDNGILRMDGFKFRRAA